MGKKKAKQEKPEKEKDLDLFNPVACGDDRSYYVYTNNINFRHMLSMDSVLPRVFFETDNFRPSPGGAIEWGILITNEPLDNGYIKQFEDSEEGILFTIILEYQFEIGTQIPAYLFESNYKHQLGSLEDLDTTVNSFAIIPGFLPVQAIAKIHFRSENQLNEFITVKTENIEIDESKCIVTPNLFSGKLTIAEDRVLEIFKSENLPIDLMKKQLTVRNRIKASLVASFYSLDKGTETLRTNFDYSFLSVIATIMGESSDSNSLVSQSILKQLKEFNNLPVEKIIKLIEIEDSTPFRYFAWTRRLVLNNNLEQVLSDQSQADKEDILVFLDIVSYKILLYLISESKSDDFIPMQLLQNFLQEFRERAPHLIEEKYSSDFDQVSARYEKAVITIQNVIDGIGGKIIDQLNKWPENFTTLRCLLIFLTAYSADDYYKLKEKLGKFPLSTFEKRMIWSFYGMLNGMAPLGCELKKDPKLLRCIDSATALALNCDIIPNRPYEKTQYAQRPVKVYQKERDEDNIFIDINGIEFYVYILKKSSMLWNKIKSLLSDKIQETSLRAALLNCGESKPYIFYRIPVNNFTYDKGDIILYDQPQIRKEWKNWDYFKNLYLLDYQRFEKLSDESLEMISKIINSGKH